MKIFHDVIMRTVPVATLGDMAGDSTNNHVRCEGNKEHRIIIGDHRNFS